MTSYPHLAQRLFNTPIAILPTKAEVVMAALADRFGVAHIFRADGSPATPDLRLADAGPTVDADQGYDLVAGCIAVIEVRGTLVQKLGALRPFSGMTGYDGIRQNLLAALADDQVEAIVFDIDSPGGEVSGCFDLADTIWQARGRKPLAAILTESAYSAAYAIASAVDPGRLYVPRTGGTGSVGVIYMHVEMSKALEMGGIKVTLITDGDLKADGNDVEPLSDRAFAKLQADVTKVGDLFRATVARNRGLDANVVRRTQAGTFLGAEGVRVGLADKVLSPSDAMQAVLRAL